MSKAGEALADVRRWLCDSLSDGDAGKVCGMLSVVSRRVSELESENAKLREQMERLVTLLRVDCDIDASWDGLRRFWSIGLTEGGCLMRDRACEAEAENAKLRTQLADATESMGRVEERCARLRECFPAEMGKNRGRICPTCGCIVFDDEECCPDCNAEVDG